MLLLLVPVESSVLCHINKFLLGLSKTKLWHMLTSDRLPLLSQSRFRDEASVTEPDSQSPGVKMRRKRNHTLFHTMKDRYINTASILLKAIYQRLLSSEKFTLPRFTYGGSNDPP
jgi:hypothetical protein